MGSRVRTLFALGDTPQWGMDSVLMGSCMVYLREKGVYPVIIIDYVFGLEPTEVQRAAERKEI